MDFRAEGGEVGGDGLGRLAGLEVVVAGVNDDGARLAGDDDAVGVEDAVGKFGAAKAAVDRRDAREIPGEGSPFDDGGAADENDGVGGRWVCGVGLGEFGDRGGPFFGRGLDRDFDLDLLGILLIAQDISHNVNCAHPTHHGRTRP